MKTSLWHNRNYLLLLSGQIISLVGTGISQLAYPLLVLALTHSPEQAGFVGALRGLPLLLLSLPAGALVDRWDRKKVMIICDIGRAIALFSIPVAFAFGYLTLAQLYITSLIEGMFFAFFNLAETACLPRVVDKEQLAIAAGLNEASYNITFLLSPLLGGLLYSLGKILPFIADAVSYAISVCSLILMRVSFQEERAQKSRESSTAMLRRLRAEIGEGLAWLWHQPLIRYLSLLTGCINSILVSNELIVIVIARSQHASPAFIGVILAIGGCGSVAGALLSTFVQRRFRFGSAIIGTCWLIALLWLLYTIASNLFLLAAVLAGITLIGPIYNVTQFSYRMTLIPDALQGRVNSVFRLVAVGLQPLVLALTGVLLQQFGSTSTVLIFFGVLIALAVATTLSPHVRIVTL